MKLKNMLLLLVGIFSLSGCISTSNESIPPVVEIVSRDYTYLGEELTLEATFNGKTTGGIKFQIQGNNHLLAVLNRNRIVSQNPGTVKVVASFDNVESEPMDIHFLEYDETIDERIATSDLDRLDLGKTISYGFENYPSYVYQIESSNQEILRVHENNTIEVVGLGRGNLKIVNTKIGKILYDDAFVTYNSILATEIRNKLLNLGKISSFSENINQEMFNFITELKLDNYLANDASISLGIKYLENLKVLSLSNNKITDISFVSTLTKLEELNLSKNTIVDISPLNKLVALKKVNLSDNRIVNISTFTRHEEIVELNLAKNSINDLSPISTLFSLEALYLGENDFDSLDHISGLQKLKKLDISDASIEAEDVFALSYVNKLEYLNMNGITITSTNLPDLDYIKELYLDRTSGQGKFNLSTILKYSSLRKLSVSGNNLNLTEIEPFLNEVESRNLLTDLEYLNIGANKFVSLPDLSIFPSLKTLDLSGSRNLIEIHNLSLLTNLDSIILDHSRSISLNYSVGEVNYNFVNIIDSMPNLTRLSLVGGLHILTREVFTYLETRINEGLFSVQIIENEWMAKDTIVNLKSAIFFSIDEFKADSQLDETTHGWKKNFTKGQRRLILSLIEPTNESNTIFIIPSSIFSLEIYGRDSITHRGISFYLEDRKQSDFNFTFNAVNMISASTQPLIYDDPINEGHTYINFAGTNNLTGNKAEAVKGHDVSILSNSYATESDRISLKGGNGENGRDGITTNSPATEWGFAGQDGFTAVVARNNLTVHQYNISLIGGNGGHGGRGGDGGDAPDNNDAYDGGRGGKGGNGGHAFVALRFTLVILKNNQMVTLTGGLGGAGGSGGVGGPPNSLIYQTGSQRNGGDGGRGGDGGNGGNSGITLEMNFVNGTYITFNGGDGGAKGLGGKGANGASVFGAAGTNGTDGNTGKKGT